LKWERGRAEIDRMLADHELDNVPASREQASRLIGQARTDSTERHHGKAHHGTKPPSTARQSTATHRAER
jgi:hypothetical protein